MKELCRYDVVDGKLIMTVPTSSVDVCDECPDMHITVLEQADAENLRTLGAGLAHLADHLRPKKRRGC